MGASVLPRGGVRFRVWAPAAARVEVEVDGAVAAMRSHLRDLFRSFEILAAREPGYFVDETAGGSAPPPRAVASPHHVGRS